MSLDRLNHATQSGILSLDHLKTSLGRTGMSDAERLLASGVLSGSGIGLEVIDSAETKAAFEGAFKLTADIYASPATDWTNLVPPTPEDFSIKHPELFTRLSDIHERMEAAGEQPKILVAAHLGKQQTTALFNAKTAVRDKKGNIIDDKGIPNNPLGQNDEGNSLWVNSSITDGIWQQCDTPPATSNHTIAITMPDGTTWSIAITSGKQVPDNLNKTHQELTDNNTPLLAISQYLRLQLGRIQAGEPPVDGVNYSWLNGAPGGSAPRGSWNSVFGRVYVDWDVVGRRYGNLGSRSPEE